MWRICSSTKLYLTLCDPMNYRTPGFFFHYYVPKSVIPSNNLILCCPLLLLHSIFLSIRIFSNELTLCIRYPKYWSFSFNISPFNIQGWFPLGLTGLISLQSKRLSKVFSNTKVQKQQFFSAKPSLQSNSHIHTRLMEKPKLWLYWPLSANWHLCFSIC